MSKKEKKSPVWSALSDLQKKGLKELQEEYLRVFGKATKSRSRKHLFNAIAKKLQETEDQKRPAEPGKSVLTAKYQRKRKILERGKKNRSQSKNRQSRPIGTDDPRLPKVGTTIKKIYKGKRLNVRILKNGFEYSGKQYRSLSAIARAITGSSWNGYLFFGLTKRSSEKR